MEATGVYWEKVWDVLSDAGLDVMVVNARHVKQIKGRKTGIADSVWLSRICQFGLGSPSLALPKFFRDLRGLSRYRRALTEQRARSQLRIQKVLDRGGVRIGRKASRWLQKLEQYGYVTRRAREEQTDMPARSA